MKYMYISALGVVMGLFIGTRIELHTGQCLLYWYDKIFRIQ